MRWASWVCPATPAKAVPDCNLIAVSAVRATASHYKMYGSLWEVVRLGLLSSGSAFCRSAAMRCDDPSRCADVSQTTV
jgi:hypothetical protein